MTVSFQQALLWWSALHFRGQRADFYTYLAAIIEALEGRKTIKQILLSYAQRHGPASCRGRLALHWADRLEDTGDLAYAFQGTLPAQDVAILSMLQRIGGGAMPDGLRDLAALLQLHASILRIFAVTMLVALFGLLFALTLTAALPMYIVPQLRASYGDIAPDFYGVVSRRMFAYADLIDDHWLLLCAAGFACIPLVAWALPNWHGTVRDRLDRIGLLALYRNLQSIRFLVTLSIIVQPRRTAQNIGFREAMLMLSEHGSRWQNAHYDRILPNMQEGQVGAAAFNTGILDDDTYAYLDDMDEALGLNEALQRIRPRLEDRALRHAQRKAQFWRIVILVVSILYMLAIYLGILAVTSEMRTATLMTTGI